MLRRPGYGGGDDAVDVTVRAVALNGSERVAFVWDAFEGVCLCRDIRAFGHRLLCCVPNVRIRLCSRSHILATSAITSITGGASAPSRAFSGWLR